MHLNNSYQRNTFFIGKTKISGSVTLEKGQTQDGYINITELEAWDMLNSTIDGRQIPIATRRPKRVKEKSIF